MQANEILKEKLRRDVKSVDLLWSLFFSAVQSYRHDSICRPFPPSFINQYYGEKDFALLKETANDMPCLRELSDEHFDKKVNANTLNLLSWLISNIGCDIRTVAKTSYESILNLTDQTVAVPEPTYIFEVIQSSSSTERFETTRGYRKLIYGYHGSKLENFYSILHNGLHYHLNKNSLYGKGIYLSSELSMCFLYSPAGIGWNRSLLGERLSCIALCEVVDHPDVKCQCEGKDTESSKERARAKDSEAGDVPEKYYVVLNDSLIRVKYLLVYSTSNGAATNGNLGTVTSSRPWYVRHKFLVVMATYVLILIAVGLMNSRKFTQFLRRILS